MNMRDMSQGGVGVGTMSHECERYESGWSRCEKKRKGVRMNRNITPLLSLKFLLKILEVSVRFSGHVGQGNVIIVEGGVVTDFLNEFV